MGYLFIEKVPIKFIGRLVEEFKRAIVAAGWIVGKNILKKNTRIKNPIPLILGKKIADSIMYHWD